MEYANWPRCERLLPHALAARGWIESEDLRVPEAARLLNQAGYYLYLRARYAEAEPLFRRALAIREKALGPDHPDTAPSLNNLAELLRAQGRYGEAEPLYRLALAIREKALGPDHPDTATSLNNLAGCSRPRAGTGRPAVRVTRRWRCSSSSSCCRTRSGRWAPTTPTRSRPAATSRWTGEAGDAQQALRLFAELLPDQERVLGRDHPDTLTTRGDIAGWTGEAGDVQEALRLSAELLPDQEQVLGRDHPDTLATRHYLAHWTGEDGRRAEGVAAVRRAAAGPGAGPGPRPPRYAHDPQQHRALDRRDGRRAAGVAALRRAAAGPGAGPGPRPPRHARDPRTHRVLDRRGGRRAAGVAALRRAAAGPGAGPGPRPPRHAQNPPRHRALDRRRRATRGRRCGSSPSCCRTRSGSWAATTPTRSRPAHDLARWTGETGDAQEALRLFAELLPDQERVLGRDHPDTLMTRHDIARWTGEAGDAPEALRLFAELLPDQERVLGRDHPDTLMTLGWLGVLTIQSGDHAEGCRLLREGLSRTETRFGHRSSVDTANSRQDPRPRLRRSGADRSSYARASLIIRPTAIRPR